MARPLRIEAAGCWYHVTTRGNERRAIFRQDADRRKFLELLAEAAERFELVIHAYVLMDNHYHLLLQTRQPNLSRAMQWLGISYTVWFNQRHRRSGHLFQGRYHAVALEQTAAAAVSRYLHLNPVRMQSLGLSKAAQQRSRLGMGEPASRSLVAERIGRLRQYRWSSYRAYAGLERGPKWLTTAAVGQSLGADLQSRQWPARYREFVESAVRAGRMESPWERIQGQMLLGSAEFVARMRRLARGDVREQPALRKLRPSVTLNDVVATVAAMRAEPWEKWRDRHGDWGREAVLWFGRKRCGLKLQELGAAVGGLDYRSVSSALRQFARRLETDKNLARQLRAVENQLQKNEM
jgi:putative transposase